MILLLAAAPVCAQEGYKLGFIDFGAHIQAGLFSNNHGARGAEGNGDLGLSPNPDFNVNQAWLWFGREAKTETNEFDCGFRFDAFYGVDAFYAVPFNSSYTRAGGGVKKYEDANFMRGGRLGPGVYGLALPQLYAEISYYKWKLAAGRFFPLIGYEEVDAPRNDFYSKTFYTMLTVPSSGTGAMLEKSYGLFDFAAAAYYGLDSGFENLYKDYFFSGAANYNLSDNSYLYYAFIAGRYGGAIGRGKRLFAPEDTFVYLHNLIFEFKPAGVLKLATEVFYNHDDKSSSGTDSCYNIYGFNEYAVYDISEKFAAGLRAEWARHYDENKNRYGLTANVTYKPVKWFYVRPEARYSWGSVPVYNGGKDTSQFNFGLEITAKF